MNFLKLFLTNLLGIFVNKGTKELDRKSKTGHRDLDKTLDIVKEAAKETIEQSQK